MFDHVTIRVADRSRSEPFFLAVLETLGVDQSYSTHAFAEWRDFSLAEASDERPVTRNVHIGFTAPSREQVDAFWKAGLAAGGVDDGPPGERPEYLDGYYGAFLRDPDGNSVEAVHHPEQDHRAAISHVWIRVADLQKSAAFYRAIAPGAGLTERPWSDEHATFVVGGGNVSFTVTPGAVLTENVHIAFKGGEEDVRRFHAAATAAGYRDNGVPGERPQYHPGYYAAYVLDPDGHNVEVVDHHRD